MKPVRSIAVAFALAWPGLFQASAHASDENARPWPFSPPRKADPPDVRAQDRVRNPIDAFLLDKLDPHPSLPKPPNASSSAA